MARVEFDRNGQSGNIFFILGAAAACLSNEDRREMVALVRESGSYEAALAVIGRYVDLVDVTDD